MRVNKNGFTLIELLAVIIILGVLMLIAIPSVTEYISTSRQKAFLSTASNILDNAKRYVVANSLTEGKEFTISNGSFSGDGFDVRGKLPNSGTISVNEQMQTAIAVTDGSWCAKKTYSGNEIIVTRDNGDCSIDSVELTPGACFAFNSGTGMITGYYEHQGNNSSNQECPNDVVIPSSIDGVAVTSIGPGALMTVERYAQYCYTYDEETDEWGDDVDVGLDYIHTDSDGYYECYVDFNWDNPGRLTSVVIPDSITYIGISAFQYNQLTNITIPDSVTIIGVNAFSNNQIANLTLGSGITKIGSGAFSYSQLTSLDLSGLTNLTSIGSWTFGENQIVSLDLSDSTNLITIGESAFNGNQLTSLNLSGLTNLTTIGVQAFVNNQLTILDLSGLTSLTTINDRAFRYNQLTSLNLSGLTSLTKLGYTAFSNNQLTSIDLTGLTSLTNMDEGVFSGNLLTNVKILSNVSIFSGSISTTFHTAYVMNNSSLGGTYTSASQGGVWTKQ